jgi:4-amino-4-deoxy-L-arabinose transferase-like glycosyltransferase
VAFRNTLLLLILCAALYLPGLGAVPPLDRDEARFAQATKQMLESGDWIDVRFQDEPRYKKPVGIYWLQAASASVWTWADRDEIWIYRVPSVIGATVAVLLTTALAALFLPPGAALTAGALLAVSVLLIGEAHQAKTDAVLLATLLAAQYGLARAYIGRTGHLTWLPFWLGIGVGGLVKGPIVAVVALLTLLALAVWERRAGWLLALKPLIGLPLAVAIVAPWVVAIQIQSGGAFLAESLGADLGDKLTSGQEAHGAPPGYYLLLVTATFWPASLLLWPALRRAWTARAEPLTRFCLAWLVPGWILFEAVPTKLPHYPLPLYPALAILCAAALLHATHANNRETSPLRRGWANVLAAFVASLGIVLGAAAIVLSVLVGSGITIFAAVAGLAGATFAIVVAWLWQHGDFRATTAAAIVMTPLVTAPILEGVIPSLDRVFLAPRLAEAVRVLDPDGTSVVASTGFREPSLVFLLGTGTRLVDPDEAATLLAETDGAIVLVESRNREEFEAALADLSGGNGIDVVVRATVEGLNYSKGDEVAIDLVMRN